MMTESGCAEHPPCQEALVSYADAPAVNFGCVVGDRVSESSEIRSALLMGRFFAKESIIARPG